LSIAASVVVLVGTAVFFIPKKAIVKSGKPLVSTLAKTGQPVAVSPSAIIKPQTPAVNNFQPVALAQNTKTKVNIIVKRVDTASEKPASVKPDDQPVMASVQQTQAPAKIAAPDKPLPLLAPPAVDQLQASATKPAIAALPLTVIKKDSLPVRTRPGIHSLGDLVNVLVAKVDKRKDKIIEFTADDDGESTVTGLNLGIIKLKKRGK
jgi:hypothetical protein